MPNSVSPDDQINLNNELVLACDEGNLKDIFSLAEKGANVNEASISWPFVGTTPLRAAIYGTTAGADVISALVDLGADVNEIDFSGQTPLFSASYSSRPEAFFELIRRGAKVDVVSATGMDLLHFCAAYGSREKIFAILDKKVDVNLTSDFGITAIHYSAGRGNTETMFALASRGADANRISPCGETALMFAVRNGNVEQTSLALISCGAKSDADHLKNSGMFGLTMRQAAVRGGFTDRLQELFDDHPSSSRKDHPGSLIKYALKYERPEMAEFIRKFLAVRAIEEVTLRVEKGASKKSVKMAIKVK